jgi:hypothetical protein
MILVLSRFLVLVERKVGEGFRDDIAWRLSLGGKGDGFFVFDKVAQWGVGLGTRLLAEWEAFWLQL